MKRTLIRAIMRLSDVLSDPVKSSSDYFRHRVVGRIYCEPTANQLLNLSEIVHLVLTHRRMREDQS